MYTVSKTCLGIGLTMAFVASAVLAEEKPAFKDDKEKASYAVGLDLGTRIKRAGLEVDVDVVANGIRDVMAGKEPRLTEAQVRETLFAYQQAARKQQADKNTKEGETYLAENKKKEGVKTHAVTLADGKSAELQYKSVKEGTGKTPGSNDVVTVHYRGTFIDGKEFDSSAKRGQPAQFPVNRVIRGWTEALQLMKVGSKWELAIPAALAYGENGQPPNIPPGATLLFEVELLNAEAPQPPAGQPLTSDIIRVPSADEIKQGAQIQVIKPEDLEKAQKSEQQKAQKKPEPK